METKKDTIFLSNQGRFDDFEDIINEAIWNIEDNELEVVDIKTNVIRVESEFSVLGYRYFALIIYKYPNNESGKAKKSKLKNKIKELKEKNK